MMVAQSMQKGFITYTAPRHVALAKQKPQMSVLSQITQQLGQMEAQEEAEIKAQQIRPQ